MFQSQPALQEKQIHVDVCFIICRHRDAFMMAGNIRPPSSYLSSYTGFVIIVELVYSFIVGFVYCCIFFNETSGCGFVHLFVCVLK